MLTNSIPTTVHTPRSSPPITMLSSTTVNFEGDAACPPIHKLKGHDWFIWDIKGEQWVYDQQENERSRKEAKRNFALDFGNG